VYVCSCFVFCVFVLFFFLFFLCHSSFVYVGGRVNSRATFELRKKLRDKLRKIPKADLSNSTLRKECTLHVNVKEATSLTIPVKSSGARNLNKSAGGGSGSSWMRRAGSAMSASLLTNRGVLMPSTYCSLELDGEKKRTPTIFNTRTPFWGVDHAL